MQQTVKITNTLNRELYEQSSLGWHFFQNCYRGKTGTIMLTPDGEYEMRQRVKTPNGHKYAIRVSFNRPHTTHDLTLWFFEEDTTYV